MRSVGLIVDTDTCEGALFSAVTVNPMTTQVNRAFPEVQDLSSITLTTGYGLSCDIVLTLSPTATFLTASWPNISLSTDDDADIGTHNFDVTLSSALYPTISTTASFTVTIGQCVGVCPCSFLATIPIVEEKIEISALGGLPCFDVPVLMDPASCWNDLAFYDDDAPVLDTAVFTTNFV